VQHTYSILCAQVVHCVKITAHCALLAVLASPPAPGRSDYQEA
jgi:hypothetical protein